MEIETNTDEMKKDKMVVMLPQNPKKYVGHIRSFQNRYNFEYISKDMKIKELFYHKDIGSKELAYEATLLFQKKWCLNHHLITNLYYYVNEEYLLVELNHQQKMKVDLEDKPIIEKYNWRMQNHFPYPTTFIMNPDDKKKTFISFQKMKYDTQKIHFKNGDRFDFRKDNVVIL